MENKKAVILVVTHKPDRVYSDEIYTPIQVGKANSNMIWVYWAITWATISAKRIQTTVS